MSEPEHETVVRHAPTLTDAGNAQRFAQQHGDNVRYCYVQRSWYIWTGTHWHRDAGDRIMRLAKETARSLYLEAATAPDKDLRQATGTWARHSEAAGRLAAMVSLAQSEPGIAIVLDQLDVDPWALNCTNGTLDLKTGTLRAHRREDLLTKCLPIGYDPAAPCPVFDAFLDRIMASNAAVMSFLQRGLGYALTGDTREQVVFVGYGDGSNGKTTLLATAVTMLGDYAVSTGPETFMTKKPEHIPNDVARLKGTRLVLAVEAEAGQRLAEGLVKRMTGQDPMPARFLNQEWFEFLPTFKIFFMTNHRPEIRETSHAIWRRVKLVPFTVTIPDDEQDKHLPDKLRAESAGILAWMVRGCLDWQRDGLGEPDEVRAATAQYREDMDFLGDFLRDECVREPEASIAARALYEIYQAWATQGGQKKQLTETMFSLRLRARGLVKHKTNHGKMWLGLRRRDLTDTEPDWIHEETP